MRETLDQIRERKMALLTPDQRPSGDRVRPCLALEHKTGSRCTRPYGHLEGKHVAHDMVYGIIETWPQSEEEVLEILLEGAGIPKDIYLGQPPAAQVPVRRSIVDRVKILIESETKLARYAGDMWQLAMRQRDLMKDLVDITKSGGSIAEEKNLTAVTDTIETMAKYVDHKPEFLVGVGHKMADNMSHCINCGSALATDIIAPCRTRR